MDTLTRMMADAVAASAIMLHGLATDNAMMALHGYLNLSAIINAINTMANTDGTTDND